LLSRVLRFKVVDMFVKIGGSSKGNESESIVGTYRTDPGSQEIPEVNQCSALGSDDPHSGNDDVAASHFSNKIGKMDKM